MRKAWSALVFIIVAAIVIQVAAAMIQPYLPTIITVIVIVFVITLVVGVAVFLWRLLRGRRTIR